MYTNTHRDFFFNTGGLCLGVCICQNSSIFNMGTFNCKLYLNKIDLKNVATRQKRIDISLWVITNGY